MKRKLIIGSALVVLSAVAIAKVTESNTSVESLLLINAEALTGDELPDGYYRGETMDSKTVFDRWDWETLEFDKLGIPIPVPIFISVPCCKSATESDACNKNNADYRC